MNRLILSIALCIFCLTGVAQDLTYTITGAGQSNSGNYLVSVKVNTKKKVTTSAENLALMYAVHGVMFKGVMSETGYDNQKPLISDPNIEQTKADFFNAFFNEGKYRTYASLVPSTLSIVKNKQTKCTETMAMVIVDKESLQHYLEKSGIVQGFSNLW